MSLYGMSLYGIAAVHALNGLMEGNVEQYGRPGSFEVATEDVLTMSLLCLDYVLTSF